MVVAVFVLCIALGSFAVSAMPRIPAGALVGEPVGPGLPALSLLDPLLELRPTALTCCARSSPADDAFRSYHLAALLGVLCALAVPIGLLAGATLPLLFHHLRREVGDLGAVAGRLYAWNTLGSLLGALLGGYALLFWLDLHQVYRIAVAALAVGGAILVVRIYRVSWAVATAVLLAPGAGRAGAPARVAARRLMTRGSSGSARRLPTRTPAPRPSSAIGRPWSSSSTTTIPSHRRCGRAPRGRLPRLPEHRQQRKVRRQHRGGLSRPWRLAALIPALMADRMRARLRHRLRDGRDGGRARVLREHARVVVAEISPGRDGGRSLLRLRQPEREHQSPKSGSCAATPTARCCDSREPLRRHRLGAEQPLGDGRRDALQPRVPRGRAFADCGRGASTASGSTSTRPTRRSCVLVLRTYAAVFDDVAVWYGRGNDLLLLGFKDGPAEIDLERLRSPRRTAGCPREPPAFGCGEPPRAARARTRSGRSRGEARAHRPDPYPVPPPSRLHRRARLLRGKQANVPFTGSGEAARAGRENSLWRRYLATLGEREADEAYEQFALAVCANRNPECVAALADWQRAFPESARLQRATENLGQSLFTFGGRLEPDAVRRYFDTFVRPSGGEPTPEQARRATLMFRRHHFHAASPSPKALVDLWTRCRAPGADADGCAKGLAMARRMAEAS